MSEYTIKFRDLRKIERAFLAGMSLGAHATKYGDLTDDEIQQAVITNPDLSEGQVRSLREIMAFWEENDSARAAEST